jgi:hypothetical protein
MWFIFNQEKGNTYYYEVFSSVIATYTDICRKRVPIGLFQFNKGGHKAPHLQTHVSSKLRHVSEDVPSRFGLVDAKLSSQGLTLASLTWPKHERFLYIVQYCVARKRHISVMYHLFWEQNNNYSYFFSKNHVGKGPVSP